MEEAAASTEIWVLGWSVVLLIVHILVQALSLDLAGDLSVKYLLGPRDEQRTTKSIMAGRLLRSLKIIVSAQGRPLQRSAATPGPDLNGAFTDIAGALQQMLR